MAGSFGYSNESGPGLTKPFIDGGDEVVDQMTTEPDYGQISGGYGDELRPENGDHIDVDETAQIMAKSEQELLIDATRAAQWALTNVCLQLTIAGVPASELSKRPETIAARGTLNAANQDITDYYARKLTERQSVVPQSAGETAEPELDEHTLELLVNHAVENEDYDLANRTQEQLNRLRSGLSE